MTHKKILYTVAYTIIFVITVQLFSCTDCSKPVLCPGYKDELLDAWFPYNEGTAIEFATNTGLTQKFTFRVTYQTEDRKVKKSRGCDTDKRLATLELDSSRQTLLNVELSRIQDLYSNEVTRVAYLRLFRTDLQAQNLDNNGFGIFIENGKPVQPLNYPSIELNGRIFTNVQSVLFDTTSVKGPPITRLYISKMHGIVAYQTREGSLLWVKQ
jgi:hypothetical protein